MVRRMACWHVYWHIGKQNEKLARFWHAGTLARKPRWHASTLARKPRWHASTFAGRPRWHADTHSTQISKL